MITFPGTVGSGATEEMPSLFDSIPFPIVTPTCSLHTVLAGLGYVYLLLPVACLIEEEEVEAFAQDQNSCLHLYITSANAIGYEPWRDTALSYELPSTLRHRPYNVQLTMIMLITSDDEHIHGS